MSGYYDDYGNWIETAQQENQDPLAVAYAENPVQVIQQAAYLAAQQAAESVGQTVYAKQNWEYQQAAQEAAKSADEKMVAQFGAAWEHEKAAFANEWITPRANILLDNETVIDADALATKLASGFRLWHDETVEEQQRVQALENKEFADDLIRVHQDSTYAARMSNADFQRALREVQGR